MHARRPGPARGRGVVASAAASMAAALALALAGCSDTPTVAVGDLSEDDRRACAALVEALPDRLAGEELVAVEPDDAPGAAWGDPAYVLTCGVPEPAGYEPTAVCSVIDGVGWYVADDQLSDPSEDATPIALSLTPYVEVLVPADHRTEGVDRALAELAPVLREHLDEGLPCL